MQSGRVKPALCNVYQMFEHSEKAYEDCDYTIMIAVVH